MLADKLSVTALTLITKYGNDVVFSLDEESGTYDPVTDSYDTNTVYIATKGVYRKPSFNDDKSVSKIVKIPYDARITTDFKLDGNAIISIEPIKLQNKVVVMDIYI